MNLREQRELQKENESSQSCGEKPMSTLFAAHEAKLLLDAAIKGDMPDDRGRFGPFGGRYVPETLVPGT